MGTGAFHLSMNTSESPRLSNAVRAHRSVSFMIHSMYGNESLSSRLGSRELPITLSISACAFWHTSGCRTMASTKVTTAADDYAQ